MVPVSRRTAPIVARDRMLLGKRGTRLQTGFTLPTAEALRLTLRELATLAPGHRIFARPSADGRRWIHPTAAELPDVCDSLVVVSRRSFADEGDAVGADIQAETGPVPPFQFIVGPDYLAARTEHVVADGTTMLAWFHTLWYCALVGRPPTDLARPDVSWPIARALVHSVRSMPSRPVALLRDRTGPFPVPPEPQPGHQRPWEPKDATSWAVGGPEVPAELRRWRKQRAPGISVAAFLFAAVRQALENEGLRPLGRGAEIVVDNRRYLPEGSHLDGNLISGVYIEPVDPMSPTAVHRCMQSALASGRSLAILAKGAVGETLGRRETLPTVTAHAPAPFLTMTHMGRQAMVDQIPAAGDGTPVRVVGWQSQWLPEALTFYLEEVQGTLQVSAGYNAGVLDEKAIGRVVEALATDPVGLLELGRRAAV